MKAVFAYIRVSTARQGEHGVSLYEQRDAIQRFADQNNLKVTSWFEERQTAAKRGRPVFTRMVKQLVARHASGLIIHKIDRSARNLRDWADLGELIDRGVEVHLAHEALDLRSRGGRLTADIQAVVAADYIRNLREETRKGFYGRLKQGLYPRPAPLGYRDVGPGKPKEWDPAKAPLVRLMFDLYATGHYSQRVLTEELFQRGLRNRSGRRVRMNEIADLLKNPFYIGICRIQKTGETFTGKHPPLVSRTVFDRVQAVLTGKTVRRVQVHDYVFRRTLRCIGCSRHLIGERQKGHVYYRCHKFDCKRACIREDRITAVVRAELRRLVFTDSELATMRELLTRTGTRTAADREATRQALQLQQKAIDSRQVRLTDALIDGVVDQAAFNERKTALQLERRHIDEQLERLDESRDCTDQILRVLELAKDADLLYERANGDEKRELLNITMSNRSVDGNTPVFSLSPAFAAIADRAEMHSGGPSRGTVRTNRLSRPRSNVQRRTRSLKRRCKLLLSTLLRTPTILTMHFPGDPKEADDLLMAA